MRGAIVLVFGAAMLVGGHSEAGDGKSSSLKQVQIQVRMFEGDCVPFAPK